MLAPPFDLLRPGRRIAGMSAVLLPYGDDGRPDWDGFVEHVGRTAAAGLVAAVDMDTGFVNLLDAAEYVLTPSVIRYARTLSVQLVSTMRPLNL